MSVGANKFNIGGTSKFDQSNGFNNILIGKVISNTDEFDGGRLKIRIKGIDDKFGDSDLPYCLPLLPKFLGITPKVGESVFVILFNDNAAYDNRMWLGPIISQPQKLNLDNDNVNSPRLFNNSIIDPEQAPSTIPDAKGVYPDKEYISIQGRDNSDIILMPNELQLRVGKFETGDKLKFNKKNMGYIQLKHDVVIDSEEDTKGSVTNIVSDKINLLSYGGNPRFVLNDQDTLITDAELEKILANTQPLVYGDVLLELIKIMKNFMINHVHPYHGRAAVEDATVKDLNDFNLNRLLSPNIRIN